MKLPGFVEMFVNNEDSLIDKFLDFINEKVISPLFNFSNSYAGVFKGRNVFSLLYVFEIFFVLFVLRSIFIGIFFDDTPIGEWLGVLFASVIGVFFLVYVGGKMNAALQKFIDISTVKMKSFNILRVSALYCIFAVIAGVFFGIYVIGKLGKGYIPYGIVALVLGLILSLYIMYLLLNPVMLGAEIDESIKPAQELISISCIVLNIIIRLVPLFCILLIIYGCCDCVFDFFSFHIEKSYGEVFLNYAAMDSDIMYNLCVFGVALIPMKVYFLYMFSRLFLDIVQSILSIGEKK